MAWPLEVDMPIPGPVSCPLQSIRLHQSCLMSLSGKNKFGHTGQKPHKSNSISGRPETQGTNSCLAHAAAAAGLLPNGTASRHYAGPAGTPQQQGTPFLPMPWNMGMGYQAGLSMPGRGPSLAHTLPPSQRQYSHQQVGCLKVSNPLPLPCLQKFGPFPGKCLSLNTTLYSNRSCLSPSLP